MSLNNILLEGRKDDFLAKFRSKFTNEELKNIFLLSRDLASNHKFLMFLGDVLESGNIKYDVAKDIIEKFIKYQKVLPTKDIYLFKSLSAIQDEINSHENKVRRNVKELEGADQVYEDERFVVVTPKTHKASCYYGAGTKWCTASMNGDSHFDKYNQDGKLFYIIDKTAKSSDRFYKVALLNKYDGGQTFYDAPDKSFSNEWILGSEEWNRINSEIQSYIQSNYEREIQLFKDKESARLEIERIRKQQQAERNRARLRQQEERKREDAWNIDNDTEESNLANAVFDVMTDDYGVSVDEEEGESIYNLVPGNYAHYGLTTFEWLGEDDNGVTFAVGNWDQVHDAAKEYVQNLWDDMGVEAFGRPLIESHIDDERVEEFFRDFYESDVNDSPESYFDEEDMLLSSEQEELIENLKGKIESLQEKIQELNDIISSSDDSDEITDAYDAIEDAELEIEEAEEEIGAIQESPEGGPSYEMIEDKVDSLVEEVRSNALYYLDEFGIDISDYIDVDSLIEDVLDIDGTGPSLGSYDGAENESKINDTWYYVYRID